MKLFVFILVVFVEANLFAQDGIVKSYYMNKNLRSEISYIDGILDGTSYFYHENGNLKEEKTYSQGKLNGWIRTYSEEGLLIEEFYVDEGIKDGLHKLYYSNGGIKEVRSYEMGKLIKTVNIGFDENYTAPITAFKGGIRQDSKRNKEQEFICPIEICPEPLGGMQSIYKRLVYPEHAMLYGLQGTVTILALIDTTGKVKSTNVVKGIGLGCDESAKEAIESTRFYPGKNKGKLVETEVVLYVQFKLDDSFAAAVNKENVLSRQIEEPLNISYDEPEKKSSNLQKESSINTNESLVSSTKSSDQYKVSSLYKDEYFECGLDKCAMPLEGIKGILNNLVVPKRTIEKDITGTVEVMVTVDENGSVRNTRVINGLGYGADEAVEVAILETNFQPGAVNGNNVRSEVLVRVPFRK